MGDKKIKIIKYIICLAIILLVLAFNLISFIVGPINVHYKNDQESVLKALDGSKYIMDKYINKYDYDKSYYVVKVLSTSGEKLIWISDDKIIDEENYNDLNYQKAKINAGLSRELINEEIILGYFDNQPVYIVYDDRYEIRVSFESHEVISVYEKRVRL